jgi:hypothetical protein
MTKHRAEYRVFKKRFRMVFQMLLCGEYYENLYLNAYKLSVAHRVQRWIVCTLLSVNVLLATQ